MQKPEYYLLDTSSRETSSLSHFALHGATFSQASTLKPNMNARAVLPFPADVSLCRRGAVYFLHFLQGGFEE
jgi:hypothetical protein